MAQFFSQCLKQFALPIQEKEIKNFLLYIIFLSLDPLIYWGQSITKYVFNV